MSKILKVKADFVTSVEVNKVKVLAVFNVESHNANELEKGEVLHKVEIEDETDNWVYNNACVFIGVEQSDRSPKHMKIELIT